MKTNTIRHIVIISGALAAFSSPALANDYKKAPYIHENSYAKESPSAYQGYYTENGYQRQYYGNYPQEAPAYAQLYDNDATYYQQPGGYYPSYTENETGYYYYPEDNDAGYYYTPSQNNQAGYYYDDNDAYYAQYYQQQYAPSDNDSDYVPTERGYSDTDTQDYAVDNTSPSQGNMAFPMLFDE